MIAAGFPDDWNIELAEKVNEINGWVRENRLSHPLWKWIVNPISDSMDWGITRLTDLFEALPWFTLPLVVFALIARNRQWTTALVAAACAAYPSLVGLSEPSAATLALIVISVITSALVGIPIGVAAAHHPRVDAAVRPVLDAMQTIPSTVYLIPVVLFFGIGGVPAAIATVVYALPPMVRLTTLGIRQVPEQTVEAGRMMGSTDRQLLTKIELPLAVPSILTGVNQTINMALGIVVIAALVGAGGLGQEVIRTLKVRSPGRGMVAGLAIVAIAVMLDRVVRSFVDHTPTDPAVTTRRWLPFAVIGGIVAATLAGRAAGADAPPFQLDSSVADAVDSAITWFSRTAYGATSAFNDFVVRHIIVRGRNLLTDDVPWPLMVALPAALALALRKPWLAVGSVVGVLATGAVGLWAEAIDTLVQTFCAVVIAAAIAIPVGIWTGRSKRAEAVLSPVLDALQTVPSLVYAIPFVSIFSVGAVPGLIASVLYAIPPGIRITALGIKQTDGPIVEAATSFGATNRQVMRGVRIPLATPTIILALNQVIMMVLAMVIIAGLLGAGAVGFAAVEALTKPDTGLGFEVGITIMAMAMILDRLTQALAERFRPGR